MPLDELTAAQFLVRLSLDTSVLAATGLSLHVALGVVERPASKAYLGIAALAGLVIAAAAAGRLLVTAAQLGGADEMVEPAILGLTWSALGAASLSLWSGSVATLAAYWSGDRRIALLAAVALALSYALTGHAAALEPPGPWPTVATLHVLIAAYWAAAPVSLWPRRDLADLHDRLRRFSRLAVAAIPLMIALGLLLASELAGGWSDLLDTTYGQLLTAKLGTALAAVGLGALNFRHVTALVGSDPERGRGWLRASLAAEALLFALAVTLVAVATTFVGPAL